MTVESDLVNESQINREKEKARHLRKSQWWRNRIHKGICHYCGRDVGPKEITMDHIVPIIRGGMSTKGNIAASCKECNNKKKYLLPIEWDEYLKKLKDE